jgi:hypothetical protein
MNSAKRCNILKQPHVPMLLPMAGGYSIDYKPAFAVKPSD